jgi:ISXO2 transposase-like protein
LAASLPAASTGAERKTVVAIAVEKRGYGMGRIRFGRIPDTSADSLLPFIEEAIEPGSVVSTDGHLGYKPLAATSYIPDRTSIQATGDPGHIAMPCVHRVSSLLKRWLLFYRLLEQAVQLEQVPLAAIAGGQLIVPRHTKGRDPDSHFRNPVPNPCKAVFHTFTHRRYCP